MATKGHSRSFVGFTFDNGVELDFQTEPAGCLRVAVGKIQGAFRLGIKDRAEEDYSANDPISCLVRISDSQGDLWEGESVFMASLFIEKLLDLSRPKTTRYFSNAEKQWRQAFKKRRLLRGIRLSLGDRIYRWFVIEQTIILTQFKHQLVTVDLGWLKNSNEILVKVAGLYGDVYSKRDEEDLRTSGFFEILAEVPGDWEEIPPLVYTLSCEEILFRNLAFFNADCDTWFDNPAPIPIRFRKVRGKGRRQPRVVYLAS